MFVGTYRQCCLAVVTEPCVLCELGFVQWSLYQIYATFHSAYA